MFLEILFDFFESIKLEAAGGNWISIASAGQSGEHLALSKVGKCIFQHLIMSLFYLFKKTMCSFMMT